MAKDITPVGYAALLELFNIKALPHYRSSYILNHGTPHIERINYEETHYYPRKYFLKDFQNPLNHIEFALKYDGVNLEILYHVFSKLDHQIFEQYIVSQPSSKIARKIWYLFEFLTNKVLNIDNAYGGSYTLLLDPREYYTGKSIRSPRHYIDDNLPGNAQFCPLIRRTDKLKSFEEANLAQIARNLIAKYDPAIITRAVNYLYVKETMSSYEIEREIPDSARTQRFIAALRKADHIGVLSKQTLIEIQNIIVDPRFANKDYRDFQNYIGTQLRLDVHLSTIEYICPKPENVPQLMEGLLNSLHRMMQSDIHPVLIAAAISFGFVFIHPFEDGNGRLHRFLIHYIFADRGFVPLGAIFPVSATILKEMGTYDALLESFSRPLLSLIDNYKINNQGQLTVYGDTELHYRFLDYTRFAEFLFECVEKTIQTDFKNELNFIINFDKVKKSIQDIVDMPDAKINLFIQLVIQNRGTLSAKKRESLFSMLSAEELERMEDIVQKNML